MSPITPHRDDHPVVAQGGGGGGGEATGMIINVSSSKPVNNNPLSSSDFLTLDGHQQQQQQQQQQPVLDRNGSDMDVEKQHHHDHHHADDDNDTVTDSSVVTYIDFVPPPPPPVPPPAKYKLWLLILIVVYFGVWFADEAQVIPALTLNGWLSPQAAQFLFMLIQVSVATYAALDLLVRLLTISLHGKKYGLEVWLKMERIHVWMHNTFNNNNNKSLLLKGNFMIDILIGMIQILEEGFEIFNPTDSLQPEKSSSPQFKQVNDVKCHVVLKIQHSVKCQYADKYEEWSEKIGRRAATFPGFIGLVRKQKSVMENSRPCQRTHTVYLTFDSLQTLNDWMTSPIRQALVDELTPWLDSDDVVQLVANRRLPDAWTDLLVRQGEFVPPKPPQKWKVVWLTSCGLFLSILILNQIMPYYYEQWGTVNAHERLQAFLNTLFSTFVVSYIMQPLLIMQFSHWLQRKPPKQGEEREPWRTLNDGIESIWIKLLITVVFFGAMGIKWALNVDEDE